MSEPELRCAAADHALMVEIYNGTDEDAAPVVVKCSLCGLTLTQVSQEYEAFQRRAQKFLEKIATATLPQGVPPNRLRPEESALVQPVGNRRGPRIITPEDKELAAQLKTGKVGWGDRPDPEGDGDPHLNALRSGNPLDNGIIDMRENTDGLSGQAPGHDIKEMMREARRTRGDSSGTLLPRFGEDE